MATLPQTNYDRLSQAIHNTAGRHQLADRRQAVYRALNAGQITGTEAETLETAIEARREAFHNRTAFPTPQPSKASHGRSVAKRNPFSTGRSRPRSPDRRKSLNRRRWIAGEHPLPEAIAPDFGDASIAALGVVARQVSTKGYCDLTKGEIAARAGVSVETVLRAIRKAERMGLMTVDVRPVPGRPNLPNVVRIICQEWLTWIGKRFRAWKRWFDRVSPRHPSEAQIRSNGCSECVERPQRGDELAWGATGGG